MRTLTVAVISGLVLTFSAACCCVSLPAASATTTVAARVATVQVAKLDVKTENGSIELTKTPQADFSVEAHIRAQSQERAEKVSIETIDVNGTLQVRVHWPEEGRRSNEGADLVIRVPQVKDAVLETGNGTIDATGVQGDGHYTTSNGKVNVTDQGGAVDVHTSNGAVNVSGAGGAVRAKTSNGAIQIRLTAGCSGPVDLSSSNGSIKVLAGAAFQGTIDASTGNGHCRVMRGGTEASKGRSISYKVSAGPTSRISTGNGSVDFEFEQEAH